MDEKFAALVYKSMDSGENDKRVTLITPLGVRQAVMRGVRRINAKLRAAALPFAFFEYTCVKKGSNYIITGASQIEDLFAISNDPYKLIAGGIVLDSAFAALKNDCIPQFIYMLKRIKDIIYAPALPVLSANSATATFVAPSAFYAPYLSAIRFLQYLIHDAGYGYDYRPPVGELDSPIKLLSALYFVSQDKAADVFTDEMLIIKTLIKIVDNFENKFETQIISKKLIASIDNGFTQM